MNVIAPASSLQSVSGAIRSRHELHTRFNYARAGGAPGSFFLRREGSLGSSFCTGKRIDLVSLGTCRSPGEKSEGGLCCRASLVEYAPLTAAVYGASLLGGGLFAYTRTGSKGSLGGGITGGVALGVAFFLMQVPETRDLGEAVGFGAAVLFAAIFGIRLVATGKPMPAVPLLALSTAASLLFAYAYIQTRVLLPQ